MTALEQGKGSDDKFVPTFLETKGFCDFGSIETESIVRSEAEGLVDALKAVLDRSLKQHIRSF